RSARSLSVDTASVKGFAKSRCAPPGARPLDSLLFDSACRAERETRKVSFGPAPARFRENATADAVAARRRHLRRRPRARDTNDKALSTPPKAMQPDEPEARVPRASQGFGLAFGFPLLTLAPFGYDSRSMQARSVLSSLAAPLALAAVVL